MAGGIRCVGPVLGAALIVLVPSGSRAVTVDVPISATKVITESSGGAHVLLEAGDLSFLGGMLVTRATLTVTLPGLVPTEDLDVQVYAVATRWDPSSVSWDAPWTQPGGDWSLDHYQTVRLVAGRAAKELRFDVSTIVQTIAEGTAANHGLILTTTPDRNAGRFQAADLALLGSAPEATLSVSYLNVPMSKASASGQ